MNKREDEVNDRCLKCVKGTFEIYTHSHIHTRMSRPKLKVCVESCSVTLM